MREPVALEAVTFRLTLDRRNGSFALRDRRTASWFFSRLEPRGFASLELADGRVVPLDRVEGLSARGREVRLWGRSSVASTPPVELTLTARPEFGGVTIAYRVIPGPTSPEETTGGVRAVRLLDGALWAADADPGAIACPVGLGRRVGADDGDDARIELRGPVPFLRPGRDPSARPLGYSAPLVGIQRGEGSLLVFWERPEVSVTVERRASRSSAFPGRRGVFLTLSSPRPAGEVHVVASTEPIIGLLDVSRLYRERLARRGELRTLRYKVAMDRSLEPLASAAVFHPTLAARPPASPASPSFEEVADVAERLRRHVEVEDAMFVLEGWMEPRVADEPVAAARAAGGDSALAECSRRIRAAGYLFGLALDRERLLPAGRTSALAGVEAWTKALAGARGADGFTRWKERYAPDIVLVREPVERVTGDPTDLIEARDRFARHTRDTFRLWGSDQAGPYSIDSAGLYSGLLRRDALPPSRYDMLPLFAGVYGPAVRLALPAGEAIGPRDAAVALAHLLIGETPLFAWPTGDVPLAEDADPGARFSRAGGWTEGRGLDPREVFIKNVTEICAPVAMIRTREPLVRHRALTPDGRVRESRFGMDMSVVVNFGSRPYEIESENAVLPPLGFLVRHPFFFAFHAEAVQGVEYDPPALFTVRSLEGKMFLRAERTRIYHGFGPSRIRLGGREFDVPTEAVVKIW